MAERGWIDEGKYPQYSASTTLFSNDGEVTYSTNKSHLCVGIPNDCQASTTYNYRYGLDDWVNSGYVVEKLGKNIESCCQEMLVTWFKTNTTNPFYVLNNASIFERKVIDECKQVMNTKDPINYPFITSVRQSFDSTGYTDNGYPSICVNPNTSADTCEGGCTKYVNGNTYEGHKIKYLPNSNTIPSNCITSNTFLSEIYFPWKYVGENSGRNTKIISNNAFCDNRSLTAITFGQVEQIGDGAFSGCATLQNIDWGCKCCEKASAVKTIGDSAFKGCHFGYNNDLFIPSSVESIGRAAFSGCNSNGLSGVTILSLKITELKEETFKGSTSIKEVKLSNSINKIGEAAFEGCSSLRTINIDKVNVFDLGSFNRCSSLSGNINISGATRVENNAFSGCSSISSIYVGSNITYIGSNAFNGCSSIGSGGIYIGATTPPTLNDANAFANTNNCMIFVPSGCVGIYRSNPQWSSLSARITTA